MTPATLLAVALTASQRHAFTEIHMGVPVRVVICAEDPKAAADAARGAFDIVHAWDQALSDWSPTSDAMRLPSRAGETTTVRGRLALTLTASAQWHERTAGAFDAAMGPMIRLWRDAVRRNAWPTDEEIAVARAASGWAGLRWDATGSSVTMLRDGVRLDFGGIGQGLAADEALQSLQASGFTRAMIDVSGDIAIGDPPPGETGWRIEIEPAFDGQAPETLLLSRCGVSCSGDRGQPRSVGGRPISHIVDPADGRPVAVPRQAVVIAPTATAADTLATAMCVLPPDRCASLVAQGHAEAARVSRADSDGGVQAIGRWNSIMRTRAAPACGPSASEAARPSTAPAAAGSIDPPSPAPR